MDTSGTIVNTLVPLDGEVFIETEFSGYFISNYGRMYSYLKRTRGKTKTYRTLSFHVNRKGYQIVTVRDYKLDKVWHIPVHRLLFATFHSIKWKDFETIGTIDHIDGNKLNNNLENLRLVSMSENIRLSWNEQNLRRHMCKRVNQYGLDGRYMNIFDSPRAAAESIKGVGNATEGAIVSIRSACNRRHGRRSSLGYQWRFASDCAPGEDIGQCKDKPCIKRSKPVMQMDLDGKTVRTWPSAYAAAKHFGKNASCISAAARGTLNSAYGFLWQYADGGKDV